MNKERTLESVISVIKDEKIGTITTNSSDIFDFVKDSVLGYGCFGDVLYMSLVENLVRLASDLRKCGIINENAIFSNCCDDKDYQWAFDLSDILIKRVLSYEETDIGGFKHEIKSVYKFNELYPFIYEDIAEFFCEEKREYVICGLKKNPNTELIFDFLTHTDFSIPF